MEGPGPGPARKLKRSGGPSSKSPMPLIPPMPAAADVIKQARVNNTTPTTARKVGREGGRGGDEGGGRRRCEDDDEAGGGRSGARYKRTHVQLLFSDQHHDT